MGTLKVPRTIKYLHVNVALFVKYSIYFLESPIPLIIFTLMYSQTQSLLVIDLFNHFAQNLINILAKTYEDLNFV